VVESLGLSYRNAQELNRIIDTEMPGRPKFKCEEIHFGGESFDFFFRDIIPCIRALFGDPTFATRLVFAPEHHYQDVEHTKQLFGEMHTGKWWWSVQVRQNISFLWFITDMTSSNPLSYAAQVRQWYRSSFHQTRHSSRSFNLNLHTRCT
jgi:hypothetical protein